MKPKVLLTRAIALTLVILFSIPVISGGLDALAAAYITTSIVTVNSAPVAENLEIETYRCIPVEGEFRSLDPEGDPVTYTVTKDGKKGSVTIDGGKFTYTPAEGKKGKDSFSYVAIDSLGNISNEAIVTVKILKQTSSVTYSDLEGNSAWYAAAYLAENDIFVGQRVGDRWLFDPSAPVTRGEFLVMCMELAELQKLDDMTVTGFADDSDIPLWQKPYITAAVLSDIVEGRRSDGQLVFSASDAVTFPEAAVMLNNTLSITNVSYDDQQAAVPAWACQAAANLRSCNIVTTDFSGSGTVTRADAAKMLLGASRLLGSRAEDDSLLSWAK